MWFSKSEKDDASCSTKVQNEIHTENSFLL